MKGYSKIKFMSTNKSRSVDFSDLLSFPQNPSSKTQETTLQTKNTSNKNTKNTDSFSEKEEEDQENNIGNNGVRFGVILSRNCSTSSNRFGLEKQGNAVKKAFSMKRSSSVSERYCRIHDQSVTLITSPIDDGGEEEEEGGSTKKKKKHMRGKILKACKRLFGL